MNIHGFFCNLLVLFSLLFSSSFCVAADNVDLYTFASPLYQQRFRDLTQEFRCLVCQNQALADSNAPLAQDMRKQILQMINQGATNQEIIHFLVKRYGEFVRYQPPFNSSTFLLWVTPLVLLVVGLFGLFVCFFRARRLMDSTNNENTIAK